MTLIPSVACWIEAGIIGAGGSDVRQGKVLSLRKRILWHWQHLAVGAALGHFYTGHKIW